VGSVYTSTGRTVFYVTENMEESLTLQVRTWETSVVEKGWTVFQAYINFFFLSVQ